MWQPVTGGIEKGESAMQAAVREVREETGLAPIRWWSLEHLATFYDVARDHIRLVPVFAGEVAWTDPVHLSHEHDRYAFVPIPKAWSQVLWATQRRALEALAEEVLSGSAGGAAREITSRVASSSTRSQRKSAIRRARPAATRTPRSAARRRTKRA